MDRRTKRRRREQERKGQGGIREEERKEREKWREEEEEEENVGEKMGKGKWIGERMNREREILGEDEEGQKDRIGGGKKNRGKKKERVQIRVSEDDAEVKHERR